MKRKMLKALSIVIAIVMVVGTAACGKSNSGETANSSLASSSTEASKASGEKTTVKVWTVYTPSNPDSRTQAFIRALDKANKNLTDVNIEYDATNSDTYKTKIKAAMAANEAPDVFYSWGAGFVQPFIEAGKVLALESYLQDGTLDKLTPENAKNFTVDGKIYGLTSYPYIGVLFCNKELFDSNGIKLPETYDELLTAVKAFRAKGITPISVGEKDRWPGMFWQNILAVRTAGTTQIVDALQKKASFDQPEFVKSADLLKQLVDAKAFSDGAMGLSVLEGQASFTQGKAAMYYMGSWISGAIDGEGSKVAGKVVAMKFPTVDGGKGGTDDYLGGAIDGLCVNNDSKVKDAAVKTLKYLSENTAIEYGFLSTWKLPENATSNMTPLNQQISDMLNTGKGFALAWDTFLTGADADAHKNLVAEIFGGKISPEDFAKEMQKLNDTK